VPVSHGWWKEIFSESNGAEGQIFGLVQLDFDPLSYPRMGIGFHAYHELTMPIIKADALAKAHQHFEFFGEARDETALKKLFNGATGYCQSLWRSGVINEDELRPLLVEAEVARTDVLARLLSELPAS